LGLCIGGVSTALAGCADEPVASSKPEVWEFSGTAVFADATTAPIFLTNAAGRSSYLGSTHRHAFAWPATGPAMLQDSVYPPKPWIELAAGSPPLEGAIMLRFRRIPFHIRPAGVKGTDSPIAGLWAGAASSPTGYLPLRMPLEVMGGVLVTEARLGCAPSGASFQRSCIALILTTSLWGLVDSDNHFVLDGFDGAFANDMTYATGTYYGSPFTMAQVCRGPACL
jgi:hypothetical protein